jgi:hypothetical protein
MKPVALIAYPIMNSSMSNCIVLDPFGGSGSTLIACEQTGRICHTIELDEKYAFRCFLLRLGFIGDEYKKSRKILLKNLSGSSAFKSGSAKEVHEDAIS